MKTITIIQAEYEALLQERDDAIAKQLAEQAACLALQSELEKVRADYLKVVEGHYGV